VAARRRTVVMTTHDLTRIEDLASRFDVLTKGCIRASVQKTALPQDGILTFYRQTLESVRDLKERTAA
jgi:heme exporter protein A